MLFLGLVRLGVAALTLLLSASVAMADSKAEAKRYFVRGMEAIEAGRTREGIRQLEVAYEILPHRSVLFNIGRAYASLGELDKAIDYLTRFQDKSPAPSADVQKTIDELKLRIRLRGLVDEGLKSIRDGRQQEGIILLRRAYSIRRHPSLLYNIARAYEEDGDASSAVSNYKKYLASNPKDAAKIRTKISTLESKVQTRRESRSRRRRRRTPTSEPIVLDSTPTRESAQPVDAKIEANQMERIAKAIVDQLEQNELAKRTALAEEASKKAAAPSSEDELPSESLAPILEENLVEFTETVAPEDTYGTVVVTASRRAQSPLDAPNAVTILSAEDIRLSGAQTVPDLLRRVPGFEVMASSVSDYNIGVRGFTDRAARSVLVLVDNQSVSNDVLGVTFWMMLPVELADIERIEVVRGSGAAIFGANAYTGVVNIITKRPQEVDGVEASVSVGNGNSFSGYAQFGQRSERFGSRFSASYREADKYEIDFDESLPAISTPREDLDTSISIVRANGLLEYYLDPESGTRIYLTGAVVEGDHEFLSVGAFTNTYMNGPEVRISGGLDSSLFTVRTLYSYWSKSLRPQSSSTGVLTFDSDLTSQTFSIEPIWTPEFELFGRHQMVIGGEYRHKEVEWDLIEDGQQNEDHFAVYIQDSWRTGTRLSFDLSSRLDFHPVLGTLFSPRLALIIHPRKGQALRIAGGTAFRTPSLGETYFDVQFPLAGSPGATVGFLGNPEFESEELVSAEIGYRVETDWGHFETIGYVSRLSNLIRLVPQPNVVPGFDEETNIFVAGAFFSDNRSDQDFINIGGEFSTRLFPIDGLDVGLNYSFQYIFEESSGDRFRRSPMHKGSVWWQLRTRVGIDLGTSVSYASKTEFTEIVADPASGGFTNSDFLLDEVVSVQGRMGYRAIQDRLEFAVSGVNIVDYGTSRHREHPFGNFLDARLIVTLTGRI